MISSQQSRITILAGLQWGDEGKGKIVDILSPGYDIVVRYQGGANAGHTIVFNNRKFVLHLIPSGIFTEKSICVIGNGTVIDPEALLEEINILEKERISVKGRLKISSDAHIILPYHKVIDAINESTSTKIGTTKKGIGPAYFDKYARRGIKVSDLSMPDLLLDKISQNLSLLRKNFPDSKELSELKQEALHKILLAQFAAIKDYIINSQIYLNKSIEEGKNILLEGAQGVLLDVDFGTYPFITSSSPTSGGACTGSGIPPTKITNIAGVFKAYTTRVGEGPFPTELFDATGEKIRKCGMEFGATTGRPRRCGWLDLVALKYAVAINGVTELIITKADVLDDFDFIEICTDYEIEGNITKDFINNPYILEKVKPVFRKFEGWKSQINGITDFDNFPINFRKYIQFIEDYIGIRIKYISTGPSRDEILIR